jgi:hypothetical protein
LSAEYTESLPVGLATVGTGAAVGAATVGALVGSGAGAQTPGSGQRNSTADHFQKFASSDALHWLPPPLSREIIPDFFGTLVYSSDHLLPNSERRAVNGEQ